jgi:2-polyprenyl-6-methoxyphenol hydroxylase-like FAD-dependent oxidoreductase
MSITDYKVIVVGGGPVGLTAAHALEQAGIDFLLLESRAEPIINAGSNLVLKPNGIQALAQLSLEDDLNAVSTALGRFDRLDHDAHDLGNVEFFEMMKQ